jgi:hypothetical protein
MQRYPTEVAVKTAAEAGQELWLELLVWH